MTSRHANRQTTGTPSATAELDYYQLLGVPYTATRAEITRAYRDAMKRFHPDRRDPAERAAAEEHAKLLNRAFTTLSKTESRRTYDATIKARVVQDQIMSQYFGGFGMPGSADPYGDRHRRPSTAADRRNQRRNDRHAMASIVVVFTGATLAVVFLVVLLAVIGAVVRLF